MKLLLLLLIPLVALHGRLNGGSAAKGIETLRPDAPRVQVDVLVSGVNEGETYLNLPPVLVEVSGLEANAKLWIAVHRGAPGDPDSSVVLLDGKSLSWVQDLAVTDVPGLEKVCTENGPFTLEVYTKDQLGKISLAKTTFELHVVDPLQAASRPAEK